MVAATALASDHPFWRLRGFPTGTEEEEEEERPASLDQRRSRAASAEVSMPKREQTSGATQLRRELRRFSKKVRKTVLSFVFPSRPGA